MGLDKDAIAKAQKTLYLSQEKQRLLERELSGLNSRLSISLDNIEKSMADIAEELGRIKEVSDGISTLYETLGAYTATGEG